MKRELAWLRALAIAIIGVMYFLVIAEPTNLSAAVTGKIAGIVIDAETGEPLPGANIIVQGTSRGAAADEEGNYFILNVRPGTYAVEASMIGYERVTVTEVEVISGHTTTINFELNSAAIAGQEVVVEAQREVIKMDMSSSSISARPDEVEEAPMVKDIGEFVSLQAGVGDNFRVRGGTTDETAFTVDGLTLVDNRSNEPLQIVNLSAIEEVSILKGGFNAEYGNIRSGLINVVTKRGTPESYHGSVIFRYTPAYQKHRGRSLFDPQGYFLRPYMDPDVCWVGTNNGLWDEEMQEKYPYFRGWNAVASELNAAGRDITPEEARQRFMWLHRTWGADELAPEDYEGLSREGRYGHTSDRFVDASFGGPVPFLSDALGDLTFFASYSNNTEAFGLPTARDNFREQNSQLKLTTRPTSNLNITIEGLYGEVNSVTRGAEGRSGGYVDGGDDIFWGGPATSGIEAYGGALSLYWPSAQNPFDVYQRMGGISIDHNLSSNTYYSFHATYLNSQNWVPNPGRMRDTSTVRYFGDIAVDESPYGYWYEDGVQVMTDGMMYGGRAGSPRDSSWINTLNVKFDLVSQITNHNQIKTGFLLNYDNMRTIEGNVTYVSPNTSWSIWDAKPYRIGAYLQDKIEFEGMIANIGVRVDYSNPNMKWYTVDRYSKYFKREYRDEFTEVAPKEQAEDQLRVSPRFGISHPITENAKLYFNYGHFYSMPTSYAMFNIDYGSQDASSIESIGNPSADLPRTVAYELGSEFNLGNQFLLRLAGYYKDVTEETGSVHYQDYTGTIGYWTQQNNFYRDIRGFETRIEKRYGEWIRGWLNYDYRVVTSGYTGRQYYYEDPTEQMQHGLANPYQERPLAQPIFNANVILTTPNQFGPEFGGFYPLGSWNFSVLYEWQAGDWITWDPLNEGLRDNLQWKPRYSLSVKFGKLLRFGGTNVRLYVDVYNPFNAKQLPASHRQGFRGDGEDFRSYMKSLHLPMYDKQKYQDQGYTGGNDKPGDIKSDDKPYIDMPDIIPLTFFDVRYFDLGIRVDF